MCKQNPGMDFSFFVDKANELYKDSVTSYLVEEMKGIASGLTKAGVSTTYEQIVEWNLYVELSESW